MLLAMAVSIAITTSLRADDENRNSTTSSKAASSKKDVNELSEMSIEELMDVQVVVTATRRPQQISTVHHAISVITASDIRQSGARSIPDALRLVPGVDVAELSYGNYALSIRGFHGQFSNKVLVLVDGRQIYDTLFGGTVWGVWPFQLEDIERIEVIRGPGGVVWGANAVNGVINIITKDPADQQGLTLITRSGTRGLIKQHVGYGFSDGKLRLRISGEFESSDGFKGRGSSLLNVDDDYTSGKGQVHAIYEAGPNDSITLSFGSSVVDGGWPLPWYSRQGSSTMKAQSNYILGKWSHTVDPNHSYEFTGYINDFYLSSGLRWSEYRYQQLALQFSEAYSPTQKQTVTWGIDTRWDLTSAANADPFMLSQDVVRSGIVGLYLQNEWKYESPWSFNLGGRVDYDFHGGFEPSGRASLAYAFNDTSLVYGAISHAFHMPSGARRFLKLPLAGPLIQVTTDRSIKPETLNAYEIGYRGEMFERFHVDANIYWHHYRNLIETDPRLGPPGLLQLQGNNASSLNMYGLELDIRYNITKSLTLLGNYTYQRPCKLSALLNTGSISPPEHKIMIGARYRPTENLNLSSHLYYVDATQAPNGNFPSTTQDIDSYLRLDVLAEYEFSKKNGSFVVGVRNLLDKSHPEGGASGLDNAEVPRMVFAEIRLEIK